MNIKIKAFSIMLLALLFGLGISAEDASANTDAPTIVSVQAARSSLAKPQITGLTAAGTEVLIYINDDFAGLAQINRSETETDNFYFNYPYVLSAGSYKVMAIARDPISQIISSSSELLFEVVELPAPTMIGPNEEMVTAKVKPLITGLTKNYTFVHIYIDGVYNGKTKIVEHKSGTANFAYEPFLNLAQGVHQVWTIAEDEYGRKSGISNILRFNIEPPLPAPILFEPVSNSETQTKPHIVGVAKGGSELSVFIDHQLSGRLKLAGTTDDTVSFKYEPFLSLTRGKHLIYATITDERGKESHWSNIIRHLAVVENIDEAAEESIAVRGETNIDSEDEEINQENKIDESATEANVTEKQNENENQKLLEDWLTPNVLIFILFAVGIVAWLAWLNRELLKEKENLNSKDIDEYEGESEDWYKKGKS